MSTQYAALIQAARPQAYYRLGELAGTTAVDATGNGFAGTVHGGVALGQLGAIAYDRNAAMLFDGSTGYISLPGGLNVAGWTTITVELWFRLSTTSFSTFPDLVANDWTYGHNTGFDLVANANGTNITFGVGNGVTHGAVVTGSLNANQWYHFAGTYNGSTMYAYLNGVQVASNPFTGTISASSFPISIGAGLWAGSAGQFFPGLLDEVAIYHSALSAATIANHYTVGLAVNTPVGTPTSINDLAFVKQQMVLVYDRNGRFIDTWRDAPLLAGFKESINAATTPLRVQLPRPFDNYDLAGQPGSRGTIAQGNIVQYVLFGPGLPTTGKIRYQGIIDAFQPQITENGEESVLVTITPQSSVIADHGLGGGQMFGQTGIPASYVDPVTMFNWWFQNIDPLTGHTYTYPLTLNASNPISSGVAYSYPFINQNLQSIFGTILQMLPPNWYYRINADLSVTLQQAPTLAQNTFVIGRHITAPTYMNDWTQLKNIIYLLGAQTDTTTTGDLNLKGVQSTPAGGTHLVSIVSGSDVSIFGERLLLASDTRVLDQTTLNALAAAQLAVLDQMQLRTTVRLIDYRGDSRPNIGYDIESIQVGDTCVLQDPLIAPTSVRRSTYAMRAFGGTLTLSSSATLPISSHPNAYWDVAQWDSDFWTYLPVTPLNQVVTIVALTYNFDYVDLELANLQPSQDAALGRIRQQFQDFTLI